MLKGSVRGGGGGQRKLNRDEDWFGVITRESLQMWSASQLHLPRCQPYGFIH